MYIWVLSLLQHKCISQSSLPNWILCRSHTKKYILPQLHTYILGWVLNSEVASPLLTTVALGCEWSASPDNTWTGGVEQGRPGDKRLDIQSWQKRLIKCSWKRNSGLKERESSFFPNEALHFQAIQWLSHFHWPPNFLGSATPLTWTTLYYTYSSLAFKAVVQSILCCHGLATTLAYTAEARHPHATS